jgi:hypothetical protein
MDCLMENGGAAEMLHFADSGSMKRARKHPEAPAEAMKREIDREACNSKE